MAVDGAQARRRFMPRVLGNIFHSNFERDAICEIENRSTRSGSRSLSPDIHHTAVRFVWSSSDMRVCHPASTGCSLLAPWPSPILLLPYPNHSRTFWLKARIWPLGGPLIKRVLDLSGQ
jgi:hypothetical protein